MAEFDERDLEEMTDEEAFDGGDEGERDAPQRLDADFLLDRVIPGEVDWRDLVRRHPIVSVAVASGIGFLIGRAKGSAIVAAASAGVTNAVMRQLSDVLEGEVFEF